MIGAFVGINVEYDKSEEVLAYLSSLHQVKDARAVDIRYDIIARLEIESLGELGECVSYRIRKFSGVTSTHTMIIV